MSKRHQLPQLSAGRDRPTTCISPSILSADFANLAAETKRMEDLGADWHHVDIMDGHFVPNLSIGAPVVASLRAHTAAFLDCHLMVSNPRQWVADYAKAGADIYTFHLEAAQPNTSSLSSSAMDPAVSEVCHAVRAAGMYCGIALKPGTDVTLVYPYVDAGLVDLVLLLFVEPGFGGQKFMADKVGKIKSLREKYPHLNIEVDGGLDPTTIEVAAAAGANVIVAGTAIFKASVPQEAISVLRAAVDKAAMRS